MSMNFYAWYYVIPTSNVLMQLTFVLQCIECLSSVSHPSESTNSVFSCFLEGHCCVRKSPTMGLLLPS
jgi:hypothetical protein